MILAPDSRTWPQGLEEHPLRARILQTPALGGYHSSIWVWQDALCPSSKRKHLEDFRVQESAIRTMVYTWRDDISDETEPLLHGLYVY